MGRRSALLAAGAAVAMGCHPGLGPSPWSAGAPVAAVHAAVRTLNVGYARTRSTVLVRAIDVPTRANLDYAAYHANFMIADPAPEGAPGGAGAAKVGTPFHGVIEASSLTGDVGSTPLTADEGSRPFAFVPVVEALAAHKVAGASELEDVGTAVRGESWGLPGGPQVVPQAVSELFVHTDARGKAELWVKIEFEPWFKALGRLPDQDADGVPELYGRVTAARVDPAVLAFLAGDYARKPLSLAEIKTWSNQLAGYWYPSYNTDLVAAGPVFPTDATEPDIKAELGGQSFAAPTIVMRGKPQGKATYAVFIIGGAGAAAVKTAAASPTAPSWPALPKTRPTPRPAPVAAAIEKELATVGGGSWERWAASVAPFDALVKRALASAPAGTKGLPGAHGFLFFRNALDYVVGGDLERQPKGRNPLPVIVEFKKALEARGVDFLFVPVPTKVEILPEELDARAKPFGGRVVNPWERKLLLDLGAAGVETIDLLPAFLAAREPDRAEREALFQRQDTHWTDRGLRLAARLIAARIKEYPWYAGLGGVTQRFHAKETTFAQEGDLRSRLPAGARHAYKLETLTAHQVLRADGTPYDDDPASPIVVLGDSFTGVFELMSPEHAGVSAHVALDVGVPVDLVMSYGGGPNVRQQLMRRGADALGGKKLVVWIMTARDLYHYFEEWKPLDAR